MGADSAPVVLRARPLIRVLLDCLLPLAVADTTDPKRASLDRLQLLRTIDTEALLVVVQWRPCSLWLLVCEDSVALLLGAGRVAELQRSALFGRVD